MGEVAFLDRKFLGVFWNFSYLFPKLRVLMTLLSICYFRLCLLSGGNFRCDAIIEFLCSF